MTFKRIHKESLGEGFQSIGVVQHNKALPPRLHKGRPVKVIQEEGRVHYVRTGVERVAYPRHGDYVTPHAMLVSHSRELGVRTAIGEQDCADMLRFRLRKESRRNRLIANRVLFNDPSLNPGLTSLIPDAVFFSAIQISDESSISH